MAMHMRAARRVTGLRQVYTGLRVAMCQLTGDARLEFLRNSPAPENA